MRVQHLPCRRFYVDGYRLVLPDHTTLRKTSLEQLDEEMIPKVRHAIGDNPFGYQSTSQPTRREIRSESSDRCAHRERAFGPVLLISDVVGETSHTSVAQASTADTFVPSDRVHGSVRERGIGVALEYLVDPKTSRNPCRAQFTLFDRSYNHDMIPDFPPAYHQHLYRSRRSRIVRSTSL